MTAPQVRRVSIYEDKEEGGLALDGSFSFQCHAGLPCFNQCCRIPTVILSPYDLLRLKQCLGISSGKVLQRYTRQEIEAYANLPLVLLDPARDAEGRCPFVGADGCTVYAHRPAACRLFPITMGSRLTPQGVEDHYFQRQLDYCRGFEAEVSWTVADWLDNQGFGEYDRGRRPWLEIMLRAGVDGRLDYPPQVQDLFATLAYDLDRFRTLLFEPDFLQAFAVGDETAEHLKTDDLALLEFSYRALLDAPDPPGGRLLTGIIRKAKKFFETE